MLHVLHVFFVSESIISNFLFCFFAGWSPVEEVFEIKGMVFCGVVSCRLDFKVKCMSVLYVVSCRGKTTVGVNSCRGDLYVWLKLTAVGVIFCRGGLGQLKLTAVGVVSCRGDLDVCLLYRRFPE